MKNKTTLSISIIFGIFLNGCAEDIYVSRPIGDNKIKNPILSYSLPKGLVTIKFTHIGKEPCDLKYSFENSVALIADKNTSYILDYQDDFLKSTWHDDDFNVNVNNNGLLTSTTAKSTDQSHELVNMIGELIGTAATYTIPTPGLMGSVSSISKEKSKECKKAKDFQYQFDPYICTEFEQANEMLKKWSRDHYSHSLSMVNDLSISVIKKDNKDATPTENLDNLVAEYRGEIPVKCKNNFPKNNLVGDGLLFRTLIPITTTIQGNAFATKFVSMVPNQNSVYGVNVKRGKFISRDTKLTFENGILTNAEIKKPSVAIGAAKLPFDLAKAAIKIPTALLQFRLIDEKATSAELKAELEAASAKKDLFVRQQELNMKTDSDSNARQTALIDTQKALLESQKTLAETQRLLQEALDKNKK